MNIFIVIGLGFLGLGIFQEVGKKKKGIETPAPAPAPTPTPSPAAPIIPSNKDVDGK